MDVEKYKSFYKNKIYYNIIKIDKIFIYFKYDIIIIYFKCEFDFVWCMFHSRMF